MSTINGDTLQIDLHIYLEEIGPMGLLTVYATSVFSSTL